VDDTQLVSANCTATPGSTAAHEDPFQLAANPRLLPVSTPYPTAMHHVVETQSTLDKTFC
jgi:hypothetical protein